MVMLGRTFEASRVVYRCAMRQACTDLDDEVAKEVVKVQIQGRERGVRRALGVLRVNRHEYQGDRAYRLLEAAYNNEAVAAIAADVSDLFARERELGHMPLGNAFGCLTELEPRLNKVDLDTRGDPDVIAPETLTRQTASGESISMLVGPSSQHPDPLVRSGIALNIASQFLAIQAGESGFGKADMSYFDAPGRRVVRAGSWSHPEGS